MKYVRVCGLRYARCECALWTRWQDDGGGVSRRAELVDGGWRVANSLVRQEARNCPWAIGRVCGREGATVSRVIFVGCAGGIDDGA
jgi:hypothetical protein